MKNRVQMVVNILIIIFMPFMVYINISDSKVNVSMADIMLVLVGIVFFINVKEFFIQKRWLYLLYFVGLLLSLFLSQYISQFNDGFLHVENSVMVLEMVKTIAVAMYFFTAFMLIKSERDFKLSLVAISLSSIPVMVIGLTSYTYFLLEKDFFIDIYKIRTLRFLGSFEDPNLCAFYFIIIFFISLLNYRILKNKLLRFLMLGISVLSLIILLLTMSRGGWLALAGAAVIYILINIKNLQKESLLIVTCVVIMILLFISLDYYFQQGKITIHIINRVQESLTTNMDGIDRVQLMRTAFKMGNDNFIFGVGKGSFPLNSYKYLSKNNVQYKMKHIPHNTILGFYAQQGIVGVLIFIMLPVYILYSVIGSKRKQNLYLVPLLGGLFIHSMSINVENIRFLWYILGLMLAAEKMNIYLDFIPVAKINKRAYAIVLSALMLVYVILSLDLSRKMAANIYPCKGDIYERELSVVNPGDYQLTFDIQTDDYLHSVEIYDGHELLKKMDFKSAYGVVNMPLYIKDRCRVVFKSHKEGWMKVKNAYIIGDNKKVPLYNYVLLPRRVESLLNNRGFLLYSDEPSFKTQYTIEDDKLAAFKIINGKVIRYSNLSHILQIGLKSNQRVDINYQLELLLEYLSLSSLLPNEYQSNLWLHRFTLIPLTSEWEEGKEYIVKSSGLFASEGFNLYGRYYDYENKVYSQKSYFPIHYNLVKEKQEVIKIGESQWINIRYDIDNDNNIHIINNGWVETGRMNLPKGDYEITFKAQGFFLEDYPKLRLRDSYLNEIAEITLDDTMKEYTINYHTDEDQKGISFILELINYKSEEGIGNRKVLLEDWVRVN